MSAVMSPVEQRSPGSSPRTLWLLAAAIAVVLAIDLVSIRHAPTPNADLQVYASIARARQLYGIGVPTETWNSPVAVDHLPFYGPVFFSLATTALRWFGVTLLSFRLTSVLGAALCLAAAALLASVLSGSRERWLWAIALTLLTPEVSNGLGTGVMHMLAVGFELLTLAAFAGGLRQPGRAGVLLSAGAGVALAMAAMTTTRSYLFIAAFFGTGLLLRLAGSPLPRDARWKYAAAAAGFGLPFLWWIVISHGDPIRWARYMTYIFTHEDTDVAILPTAMREFQFSWTPALTPLVGLVGAVLAARGIRRERRGSFNSPPVAAFVLVTAFTTYVITVVVLNYTFEIGDYFAIPLFVVVVAMPLRVFALPERTCRALVGLLLTCQAGLFAVKALRAAATWDATNPTPLNEFVQSLVPPGSVVVGPEAPYFFPVERSGSRYRTFSPRSWADWARWVPVIEPESVRHAARDREAPPLNRFFIWPAGAELPDGYDCVRGRVAGVFQPPETHLDRLGPIGGRAFDRGYPPSVLYRLPPGCPAGYDPTVGH